MHSYFVSPLITGSVEKISWPQLANANNFPKDSPKQHFLTTLQ